ncbi:protein of unknown function [Candidatus Methylomirabilis oxygeniifera]|uniref:Uncharacterized protein n=1 Tax=Methylomirabilis oxygeniifera TaxID=671143 RepID=D5MN43_METO1|nr:protein of unknown function [Candidatus Methylomirabilis oxyfera]
MTPGWIGSLAPKTFMLMGAPVAYGFFFEHPSLKVRFPPSEPTPNSGHEGRHGLGGEAMAYRYLSVWSHGIVLHSRYYYRRVRPRRVG